MKNTKFLNIVFYIFLIIISCLADKIHNIFASHAFDCFDSATKLFCDNHFIQNSGKLSSHVYSLIFIFILIIIYELICIYDKKKTGNIYRCIQMITIGYWCYFVYIFLNQFNIRLLLNTEIDHHFNLSRYINLYNTIHAFMLLSIIIIALAYLLKIIQRFLIQK